MSIPKVDQFNQLRDIFSRFDMDSDGSLTHLELAALLRSLGLQIHVLLANMDSNGNGAVEFDALVSAILPEINEEILPLTYRELVEMVREADTDGDGVIRLSGICIHHGEISSRFSPLPGVVAAGG
ncbi:hypothetical protein F0562_023543 [Nyssa sinensis]|uniref:EF-hand domain-containing protein n=1 Tax=Nyssa sinensis TaxID=561372 RepID=A0A5J5BMI2_9ASTE|nr:hypothetical protein F0562_023543 [Nyssa sinensis]